MKRQKYNIRFPVTEPHQLQQDEAFFYLKENGQEVKIRFHDYGDIYIQTGGWVAFNIKETFMQESDISGFSRLIKHLLVTDTLEIHHLERYRHRISIDGRPLFYYVVVGKKEFDISPKTLLESECV